MTKTDFIAAIAKQASLTKAQAAKAVNAFISTTTDILQQGGSLTLPGFGTFTVKQRAARTGRNPQTGEPLKIPARKVAHFSIGSQLKVAVNTKPKKKSTPKATSKTKSSAKKTTKKKK